MWWIGWCGLYFYRIACCIIHKHYRQKYSFNHTRWWSPWFNWGHQFHDLEKIDVQDSKWARRHWSCIHTVDTQNLVAFESPVRRGTLPTVKEFNMHFLENWVVIQWFTVSWYYNWYPCHSCHSHSASGTCCWGNGTSKWRCFHFVQLLSCWFFWEIRCLNLETPIMLLYMYIVYIYIYVYMNNTYNVYVYMIWYRCIL